MKTFLLSLFCLLYSVTQAQITVSADLYASGFASPVAIANAGDDRLFVVERGGTIIVVTSGGVKLATPFLDIDSIVNDGNDERGLLGLAFDPSYATNGYFYVYFIDNSGNSQLARYSRNPADPNLALATSKEIILSVVQPPGFTNHKGGNLAFGPDGYLYCGLGDGGDSGDPLDNAQNGQTLLGKMIRIDVSVLPYVIPPDNPFVSSAELDEIWATGLRNPWRWSFDRLTNDLWIADVGQGNWEEINFQQAGSAGGENYGWRCYEGNSPFNTTGCGPASNYVFPVYVYPHSGANSGCSATGGFVYRGTQYQSLFGKYIFSDYCSGNLWSLSSGYAFTDYGSFGFGMASFGEDIYGELYLANVSNGNVYHITTNECQPVAYITNDDTSYLCTTPVTLQALEGDGFTYQWLRNGFPIPGGVSSSYTPNVASSYQVVVTNSSGCSDTSTAKVVINNKPAAVITGDMDFCTGETAQLNASAGTGYTWQWKYKNVNINGATSSGYTATLAGSYRVLVTNSLSCYRLSNPFVVTGPPPGGTILNGSTTICIGDSVEIVSKASGSGTTYQWYRNNLPLPGATSINYFISGQGFYNVSVTNAFGCTKTGSGKAVYEISCLRETDQVNWEYYRIFSMDGRLVGQGRLHGNILTETYFREQFPEWKGVYIINLTDKDDAVSKKIKMVL